ncbi:MAG: hypothetical protein DRR08_22240 [Candidatus Parabeggiatoa sp. nov. 2]|nr:MAG: hypothetical protein B6247_01765 [Beggiatoa sp. 4572_84]RKZ56240.1 MAG: hypothetical protein DRR08_22240 [Gammaproteobacteria bacterium]
MGKKIIKTKIRCLQDIGFPGALPLALIIHTEGAVVSCRGNPLWLPLRYWLIDKYQKLYASVLNAPDIFPYDTPRLHDVFYYQHS